IPFGIDRDLFDKFNINPKFQLLQFRSQMASVEKVNCQSSVTMSLGSCFSRECPCGYDNPFVGFALYCPTEVTHSTGRNAAFVSFALKDNSEGYDRSDIENAFAVDTFVTVATSNFYVLKAKFLQKSLRQFFKTISRHALNYFEQLVLPSEFLHLVINIGS